MDMGHGIPSTSQIILLVHAGAPKAPAKVDVDVCCHLSKVVPRVKGRRKCPVEHHQRIPALAADDVVGALVEGHELGLAHAAGNLVRDSEAQVGGRLGEAHRQAPDDLEVDLLLVEEAEPGLAALPLAARATVAGGRVAGLRALQTVEVQQHAHRVPLAPLEEHLQVLELPWHERRHREHHPVAERHADRVDPVARQPSDVILGDPGRPVLLHPLPSFTRTEQRHEAVLVHGLT
mmetsp:Transcript_103800/g.293485  ORF Transcript_103800/g.293485 Transcript_103800/m.293485 type:complete len:234 (+) Transcript_103800:600-1301(+)